ncbi:MAG: hypothetical protein LUD72_04140 [Bacteroidales bacterium]|nr:hypothetical protein [Bacteroidales bacterium]
MLNESLLAQLVTEELNKSDVKSMIDGKLSSLLNSTEFEKKVRQLVANALENYFKLMYNRRGLWKSDI